MKLKMFCLSFYNLKSEFFYSYGQNLIESLFICYIFQAEGQSTLIINKKTLWRLKAISYSYLYYPLYLLAPDIYIHYKNTHSPGGFFLVWHYTRPNTSCFRFVRTTKIINKSKKTNTVTFFKFRSLHTTRLQLGFKNFGKIRY